MNFVRLFSCVLLRCGCEDDDGEDEVDESTADLVEADCDLKPDEDTGTVS